MSGMLISVFLGKETNMRDNSKKELLRNCKILDFHSGYKGTGATYLRVMYARRQYLLRYLEGSLAIMDPHLTPLPFDVLRRGSGVDIVVSVTGMEQTAESILIMDLPKAPEELIGSLKDIPTLGDEDIPDNWIE